MRNRLCLSTEFVAIGLALITILVVPHHLCGQTINGRIVGTITDLSQAAVPDAKVIALNVSTNETRETTTNEAGDYVISALPVGDYRVTAEHSGFSTAIRPSVVIASDTPMRVDFQLVVGEITQQVTVFADAPVLQTESSDVRKGVGARELTELPVISRLGTVTAFDQFLWILPGAMRAANLLPFINGAVSPSALSYSIDGIAQDDVANTWGFAGPPSLDATESVEVKLSSASAEYGAAMTMLRGGNKERGERVSRKFV